MSFESRRELMRLLAAHEPADDAEQADCDHIRAFVARHPNPFDRGIAEGHLTGSAFVLDPSGRVLLCWHRRLDIWVQLGGHSDGETDAAAVALREAREESGLDDLRFCDRLRFSDGRPRLLHVDVHGIPAHGDEPEHDHLDLRFVLHADRPSEIAHDPVESKALAWLELDEAGRRGDDSLGRALARLDGLHAEKGSVTCSR